MSFQTRLNELLNLHERMHAWDKSSESIGTAESIEGNIIDKLRSLDRMLDSSDTKDPTQTQLPPAKGNGFPQIPGYRVLKQLGQGGMGVVYLAEQISLNRLVALKMLTMGAGSQDAETRMRLEAAALAKVSHQNIVSVYEVGDSEGRTYFALEYLAGGSLADKLANGLFNPKEAAELLRTLAIALQTIHDRGLLHCDLKPANVLLSEGGIPKVADFGLARLLNDDQRQTRTGTVRGTPCYMPPEQADGLLGQFGPTVDIYSLGGILYEILTGRPPFLGATVLETLDQVRSKEPVPIRTLQPMVPRDLETICLKCLAKKPERRYATAKELADELTCFLEHRPIAARPPGRIERSLQWCRRNPSRAALIGVCVAMMLVAVISSLWINNRLNADLARTQLARDAARSNARTAHTALVHQAAERIDGELREISVMAIATAAALESNAVVKDADLHEWLSKLVGSDTSIYGMKVAYEPEASRSYALFAFREGSGVGFRRLDQESLTPPYWQRDWYQLNRGWTEPYVSTGSSHTQLVSFTTPIVRGGRTVGVVVVDFAVKDLKSLREELQDLIPDIDDSCLLTTANGIVLRQPTGSILPAPGEGKVLTTELATTKWKLTVSFPPEAR